MQLAKSTFVNDGGLVSDGPLFIMRQSDAYDKVTALYEAKTPAKLGILGGTFDPIHNGHIMCAEEATHQLNLDALLLIPTGKPAFKFKQPITPGKHRLAMCQLATKHVRRLALSAMEVARPGITYTAETLAIIRQCFPECVKLYFIAGADSIYALPTWKDSHYLAEVATYVCFDRAGRHSVSECVQNARMHGFEVEMIAAPKVNISSSWLRQQVRLGLPIEDFVNAGVAQYIYDHNLYVEDAGHNK
jgi:nicotinate-nucleotide adenylyltransferase